MDNGPDRIAVNIWTQPCATHQSTDECRIQIGRSATRRSYQVEATILTVVSRLTSQRFNFNRWLVAQTNTLDPVIRYFSISISNHSIEKNVIVNRDVSIFVGQRGRHNCGQE
jgi:hypothetical protein